MAATAIAKADPRIKDVRTLLDLSKNKIASALPRHVSRDRMLQVAMNSVQRNPDLLDCTQVSLLAAIMQSAQLGLEPDGVLGHAYLVPYGRTVTFIPGYKGLIELARRSGQLSTIYAQVVNEKDDFDFEFGLDPKLLHKPTMDEDAGKVTHVYAVAVLKDGGRQFDVMSRRQVVAIQNRSPSSKSGKSPWHTDWDEMAKKTVLRRLCKMLPASVDLQRAVGLDEMHDAGRDQGLAREFDLLPPAEDAPDPLEALATKLEGTNQTIDVPADQQQTSAPSEDEQFQIRCREMFEEMTDSKAIDELAALEVEKESDPRRKLLIQTAAESQKEKAGKSKAGKAKQGTIY